MLHPLGHAVTALAPATAATLPPEPPAFEFDQRITW